VDNLWKLMGEAPLGALASPTPHDKQCSASGGAFRPPTEIGSREHVRPARRLGIFRPNWSLARNQMETNP